jgi:protein-S-isoprenylcysteine O-methyltransferase Ste14
MTRAWTAIVLEALFLLLAFGWRSWLQWRRTGRTGFLVPRRGAPASELLAAGLFTVALGLLVAAPIADLGGLDRIDLLDNGPVAIAGTLLALLGIVLTVVAQLTMGESWRIGVDVQERTSLVTAGVFGLVRNPIFSAMCVASTGLLLLVPNIVSAAAMLLLVVGLELQVRLVEEPYLRSVHGSAYQRYLMTAGRFVPRVGLDRP